MNEIIEWICNQCIQNNRPDVKEKLLDILNTYKKCNNQNGWISEGILEYVIQDKCKVSNNDWYSILLYMKSKNMNLFNKEN